MDKTTIPIPRLLSALPIENRHYSLHGFCDASSYAMCTAIYLHISHPDIAVADVHLIFSKTKVKPIKSEKMTIPRMELIAVLMGTRAIKFVFNELSSIPIQPSLCVWTDSSAVVGWLHFPSPIKDIFVQNRVNSIRSLPNLIVRHIPGTHNPADIGSRGLASPAALTLSKIWWNGPEWLAFPNENWPPMSPDIPIFSPNNYKTKEISTPFNEIATFQVTAINENPYILDPKNFSRLPKFLRIFCYILRFIKRLKPQTKILQNFNANYDYIFPSIPELNQTFSAHQNSTIEIPPSRQGQHKFRTF